MQIQLHIDWNCIGPMCTWGPNGHWTMDTSHWTIDNGQLTLTTTIENAHFLTAGDPGVRTP